MIRLAIPNPTKTPGKFNYYRSLLAALRAAAEGEVVPLVLMGTKHSTDFVREFPGIRVVQSRFFDEGSLTFWFRRWLHQRYGFDVVLEAICRWNGIQVLTHAGYLRPKSKVKTIGWIYDFQHKYLADYFSPQELVRRDSAFKAICRYCDRVIVSSEDAAKDVRKYFPEGSSKVRVLRFVGATNSDHDARALDQVRAKYGLPERFFALPNQFWIHKNHKVVLNALDVLRNRGAAQTVIATGSPTDPRHPRYYSEFLEDIERRGLKDHFRILGLIPHEDVLAIIRMSIAVINPSLFEGWSTSVEEAKTLGKRVLLSTIPVHREQAPRRGAYFDPDDAAALANLMAEACQEYDPAVEKSEHARAQGAYAQRLLSFGRTYRDIIVDAAQGAA